MIRYQYKPRGYATLAMSVIILILISLIGLSLANSNISIARTIRNSIEHTVALADAESRIDRMFVWALENNVQVDTSWQACSTVMTASVFPNASNYNLWDCIAGDALTGEAELGKAVLATPQNSDTRGVIFHAIALGDSPLDGSTKAVVKDGFYYYNTSQGGDLTKTPPIVSVGNVPLNGTFSIVANPNAGGSGVPISIWSGEEIVFGPSNSFSTCQIEAYENSTAAVKKCPGTPEAGAITTQTTPEEQQYDIVSEDPAFPSPDNLFRAIIGFPKTDIPKIKTALGSNVVNTCGASLASKTGLIWVNNIAGTCDIPAMGCSGKPVVIVSESNSINITSNFCGLIYSVNSGSGDTIDANGNNFVRGAMISDNPNNMGTIMNGTFAVISDPDVLGQLAGIIGDATGARRLVKIPGAWADYL